MFGQDARSFRLLTRMRSRFLGAGDGEGGEDSDDELEEDLEGQEGMDVDTVGMVPMADMLNAQWGSENVRRSFPIGQRLKDALTTLDTFSRNSSLPRRI
jgi:hypothetical protein